MPPFLALCLTVGFITFLLRQQIKGATNPSSALWLPFLWVTISGSRFISEWLAVIGIHLGGVSIEEGSTIDAVFFLFVIAGGLAILVRRSVSLPAFVRQNVWVTIFLVYCLISVVWSDYPVVAFKRWIKLLGQPIMVLIILTEANPEQAMVDIIKRSATLLLPLSVLFIKYYPQFGRGFDGWTGAPANTGVTTNKNSLGVYCMVVGIVCCWELVQIFREPAGPTRRRFLIYLAIYFCMVLWLLYMAHSATSVSCFVVGIITLWLLGRSWINGSRIGWYLFFACTGAVFLETTFGLSTALYQVLGRDPTLTGRTEIWGHLLQANDNPILGYGFESFWLGNRRSLFSEGYVFELNSAHNGYLETYLNLGFVGLMITMGMLFSAFFKGCSELLTNRDFGRFRVAYLLAFVVYNWTEAAFRTHIVPFFVFFAIAIDYRAFGLTTHRQFDGADAIGPP